jgi:hypothetical protein
VSTQLNGQKLSNGRKQTPSSDNFDSYNHIRVAFEARPNVACDAVTWIRPADSLNKMPF